MGKEAEPGRTSAADSNMYIHEGNAMNLYSDKRKLLEQEGG